MKLSDYVALQVAGPRKGLFKAWLTMVWAVWCLLVKPEQFRVKGQDEPIELGMGGGQLWRLIHGVLGILLNVIKVLTSVVAIAVLLAYMAIMPVMVGGMRMTAWGLAKRNQRRRAKLLAEARAAMEPRQT